MAVAVKNNLETSSPSVLDRFPVQVLAGVVYVLGSLAIVFWGLPGLWWNVAKFPDTMVAKSLLGLVMFLVAGALLYLGVRLLGPHPLRGLKAGIASGVVLIVAACLLDRGLGVLLEDWIKSSGAFGENGRNIGIAITLAVLAVLIGLLGYLYSRPGFENLLGRVDDQGWFSTYAFKKSQGQRVRRGTILGILLMAGCGVFSLSQRLESTGNSSWEGRLPFTDANEVRVTKGQLGGYTGAQKTERSDAQGDLVRVPDDSAQARILAAAAGDKEGDLVFDRQALATVNDDLHNDYVKLKSSPAVVIPFRTGDVVSRKVLEETKKYNQERGIPDTDLQTEDPEPVSGRTVYQTATLLPHIQYTIPLLVGLLALWLAWRAVNLPAFADFLIATEAELNKVSWITRPRLVQDTIVVLVTVAFLAIFLLLADVGWYYVLKFTGVKKETPAAEKAAEQDIPW